MFIKRAKSRPSLRARDSDLEPSTSGSPLAKSIYTAIDVDNSIDVERDEEGNGGSVMERKKAQKKDKRKDGLGKSTRLSFAGDAEESNDGTSFKPRKSLLSQSIRLPSTPASTAPPEPFNSTSVYSKEYLSALKASTPSRAARQTTAEEVEDEEVESSGLSSIARKKYGAQLDTTQGIPDEAAVASAKSRRLAALESSKHGGNEEGDFISLGGGKIAIYDGDKGPHPESRLMREEDEEGEGDEDLADYTEQNDKLYLGKKANKAAARRMKGEIGEMIDDREAEDDDDEEAREWEAAQARRAGGWEDEQEEKPVKKGHVSAPIPIARSMPTIGPVQARLAKSLADLKVTKEENERNLDTASRELVMLEQQEQDLRKEVETVEGKREWVEEFRGWVEMLGGFLEEKFPKLEDIEADAFHHIEERAKMVRQRRTADDTDDLSLFLGVAAMAPDVEEVDEMGRSRGVNAEAGPSSGVRRGRRSDREARRARRKARPSRQTPAPGDEDGFSTDSTLADADQEDYDVAQRKLEDRVKALSDDVKAEDFRDPERGLAIRFGAWRRRYEEEYANAFGGLAMIQAWEFWARGEMVGWEPLQESSPLDAFKWFHSLHSYSHPKLPESNGNPHGNDDMDIDEEPPLGPDGDLVATMVERAVVPSLIKALEAGVFDPYSTPQTRRAVDLADVVAELTGKDSRKFTALLKAVLAVYHNHLLELSITVASVSAPSALPPPPFDPASRPAMQRFTRRRIKLMRNMLLWRRQVPLEVRELVDRLVGAVLRPVMSRTWDGGGKEMAEKVLQVAGTVVTPDLASFLREGPRVR